MRIDEERIINLANKLFKENNLDFERFHKCNAYISKPINGYRLIKSYNTIVGMVDLANEILYEFGKYSSSTSAQVTKIWREYYISFERVLFKTINMEISNI